MKSLIIIPARLDSRRLPNKPLLKAGGKALVHWTYEAAKRTQADSVIVTSPDREVGRYCEANGLTFWPSSNTCESGTHRCADVLSQLRPEVRESFDVVINWQADCPLLNPADVGRLIDETQWDREKLIATIVARKGPAESVRVAVDSDPICHWFSRPFRFFGDDYLHHVGVYAFEPSVLLELGQLTPSRLAKAESLEQLTWIVNGYRIEAIEIARAPMSVDTQEDWVEVKTLLKLNPEL